MPVGESVTAIYITAGICIIVMFYLIIRNFSYKEIPFFFRFRCGNNYDYSINDLFHIPYSKRTLVNNYRYSIAGHPSLYLGQSTFVCWNELRKPDFNIPAPQYVPNTGKAQRELGLKQTYLLPDSIKRTIQWANQSLIQ